MKHPAGYTNVWNVLQNKQTASEIQSSEPVRSGEREVTDLWAFVLWLCCSPLALISLASSGSKLMAMFPWSSRSYITRGVRGKELGYTEEGLITEVIRFLKEVISFAASCPSLTPTFLVRDPQQSQPGTHLWHTFRCSPIGWTITQPKCWKLPCASCVLCLDAYHRHWTWRDKRSDKDRDMFVWDRPAPAGPGWSSASGWPVRRSKELQPQVSFRCWTWPALTGLSPATSNNAIAQLSKIMWCRWQTDKPKCELSLVNL